ncbi:hypothetical protein F4779DRAFT_512252 [Xylariaceae sp. FL0662B]|nr:hypothetical protein F4779DRAFT_512252 [Xylariaceae sp. FL0662B]
MATPKVQILPAFGDNKFFETAFSYTLDDINKWINDCIAGTEGGERTKIKEVRDQLRAVHMRLEPLMRPKGSEFVVPGMEPDSHFRRLFNPTWWDDERNWKYETKFTLNPYMGKYRGALDNSISVEWWSPYDLLGLFISILGPSPAGADKNNYFLPLTAVYGRWCSRIAGRKKPEPKNPGDGEGDWPYMFQITWRPVGEPVTNKAAGTKKVQSRCHFFLGSSLAGDYWRQKEVGQWRRAVQLNRFNMFYGNLQKNLFDLATFDESPEQVKNRDPSKQPYGNCAETYPFIFSVRRGDNSDLSGIALQRDFMGDESLNFDAVYKNIWKNVCGPCANCAQLISEAGAERANFKKDKDKSKLPKTQKETTEPMAEEGEETAAQVFAVPEAPEGWSYDPGDLNLEYYWGPDGNGTRAARKVGLTSPMGYMIVDRDNGSGAYMFTAGGRVYLWNMLTDEVYEYTKPADLSSIVAEMRKKPGTGQFESKLLFDAE